MTIQNSIKNRLVDSGMFSDQADQVIQAMKDDEANGAMSSRWNDDESGYPVQIMALVFSAKRHAIEWIDANCPMAWYRPMFE